MNATQTAKLASLRYYGTAYEVTAAHPDGRVFLVAYTRKTGTGLWKSLINRGPALLALTGAESATKKDRAYHMGEWRIGFSGRTERESICAGEHERIPAL